MHRTYQDHVYVNANITNNTNEPMQTTYSTDMQTDYLQRSGDYYITVVRFSIPNTLHIFQFEDNAYKITLTYGGNDYQSILQFKNVDIGKSDRYIWTFQQFLDIINQGFIDAFNDLKLANPGVVVTRPPKMFYDNATSLFSIVTQGNEYLYDNANPLRIFFNRNLYNFFALSFYMNNYGKDLPSGKDHEFIIQDLFANRRGVPYDPPTGTDDIFYETKQSIETLYRWYDFAGLAIQTSDIPVLTEFKTFYRSDGVSIRSPILTDFIPMIDKDRSNFVYNANPYRLIDLDGNLPLKSFSFRVLWVDKKGAEHPYILPPGTSMSVKFGFFRKYI